MTFKKSLKIIVKTKAQASLEYFIIFGVIAILTLWSFNAFFPKVQSVLQGDSSRTGLMREVTGRDGINIDNN